MARHAPGCLLKNIHDGPCVSNRPAIDGKAWRPAPAASLRAQKEKQRAEPGK